MRDSLSNLLICCIINRLLYWYLREQDWGDKPENRARALLTENYAEKPIFTALTSLLPFIAGDGVAVLETQLEGRITSAAFRQADNELIVALVNSYPESETVSIDITEFYTVAVAHGIMYDGHTNTITKNLRVVPRQTVGDRTRCQLSLPPNTITTLDISLFKAIAYLPLILKN